MRRVDSALADSVFSSVGVVAQGLARFAYTALIGRLLGFEVLADVNVTFSIAILSSLLWPTAAGNAAAAFARADRPELARAIAGAFARSLPALAAVAAGVVWLLGFDGVAMLEVAMLTVAWSGYIFGRGIFMGAGHVRAAAVWDLVTGCAAIGALILVLNVGWEQWYLLPAISAYVIFAIAAGASRVWSGTSTAVGEGVVSKAALSSFIFWNSLTLVATNGLMQLSMVVAVALDDPARAGQFAAALSLATPVSMIAQAVTQAMLPRFGEWRSLPCTLREKALRRTTASLAVVMALGCLTVAVLLPWGLPVVYGGGFAGAVPFAQGLMVAVFGFSLAVFFAAYLAAQGRARRSTVLAGIGSAIGVVTMISVGTFAGGACGAVIGSGVGMLVSMALLAVAALRGDCIASPGGESRG